MKVPHIIVGQIFKKHSKTYLLHSWWFFRSFLNVFMQNFAMFSNFYVEFYPQTQLFSDILVKKSRTLLKIVWKFLNVFEVHNHSEPLQSKDHFIWMAQLQSNFLLKARISLTSEANFNSLYKCGFMGLKVFEITTSRISNSNHFCKW